MALMARQIMTHRFFDRFPTLQTLTFWHFHIAGWALFWCGDILLIFLQTISFSNIVAQALDAPIGCGLTLGLRQIYHSIEYRKHSIPVLLLLVLFWSIVGATVWHICMTATRSILLGPQAISALWNVGYTFRWLSQITPVWLGWSTLYFGIKYWKDLDAEQKRAREAVSLARHARLQMLRYQVNPHFLFNALNSVRALIGEDKKNAKAMITELSEFLRYSLVDRDDGEVMLCQELDALRHYLSIEKKRYEEKLDVAFDVDEQAMRFPILSFLLHPFVENAIKFGMKTSPMPLRIRVKASLPEGRLQVVVANTGSWIETGSGIGATLAGMRIGLENVRARLENAYPDCHHLTLTEENGWVEAILEIDHPSGRS